MVHATTAAAGASLVFHTAGAAHAPAPAFCLTALPPATICFYHTHGDKLSLRMQRREGTYTIIPTRRVAILDAGIVVCHLEVDCCTVSDEGNVLVVQLEGPAAASTAHSM